MHAEPNPAAPDSLGVLRARGTDVVQFLQGQLSNDVSRLGPAVSLLAGYHNPQGRVLALLRLVHLADDDLLMILPRELVASLASRLSKFILRARVRLADESTERRITPAVSALNSTAPPAHALPTTLGAVTRTAETRVVCVGETPARWLVVSPAGTPAPLPAGCIPAEPRSWQRLQIAAGLPQVYTATCGEFVAQMLNLDVLGAIAFDKGCYTGQEVVARAHYRGRVKRRMQRFVTRAPQALNAGDSGALPDGRSLRVVEAVSLADGRCEFLAVAPLSAAENANAELAHASPVPTVVEADALPLPYPLPQ
jgi:folate-binding protein YgfZ